MNNIQKIGNNRAALPENPKVKNAGHPWAIITEFATIFFKQEAKLSLG